MTKQFKDILIWQGETFSLEEPPKIPKRHDMILEGGPQYTDPMDEYLDITRTTACYRGYIATWEVVEGRLYLSGFEGRFQLPKGPVFADWISGWMLAPTKPLGLHINIHFSPDNIEYLRLEVEAGKVISHEIGKGCHGRPRASKAR